MIGSLATSCTTDRFQRTVKESCKKKVKTDSMEEAPGEKQTERRQRMMEAGTEEGIQCKVPHDDSAEKN